MRGRATESDPVDDPRPGDHEDRKYRMIPFLSCWLDIAYGFRIRLTVTSCGPWKGPSLTTTSPLAIR